MKTWSHCPGQRVPGRRQSTCQPFNIPRRAFRMFSSFWRFYKLVVGQARYLLRLWLVVAWQISDDKTNKEIWFVPQIPSVLTTGRADLVKWGFEDFQFRLDIMQPRVSWMGIDCKEQGPAAHKSQNMSGHFFLWYPATSHSWGPASCLCWGSS